jgi:hypothetical protein
VELSEKGVLVAGEAAAAAGSSAAAARAAAIGRVLRSMSSLSVGLLDGPEATDAVADANRG